MRDLLVGQVLLLVVAGAVNGGLGTSSEFEDQTISELVLAPVSRWALVTGKLLAGWVTALLVAGVVILLGAVTGMLRPSGGHWFTTLFVVALIALASSGIGVAIGARLRKTASVAPITINISIWLFFLAGDISVAAFLPGWVQAIAKFVPTYYGVHALQMSVFYSSIDQFARDVLVLIVTAALGLLAGTLSLRRGIAD